MGDGFGVCRVEVWVIWIGLIFWGVAIVDGEDLLKMVMEINIKLKKVIMVRLIRMLCIVVKNFIKKIGWSSVGLIILWVFFFIDY